MVPPAILARFLAFLSDKDGPVVSFQPSKLPICEKIWPISGPISREHLNLRIRVSTSASIQRHADAIFVSAKDHGGCFFIPLVGVTSLIAIYSGILTCNRSGFWSC